jgi:hypothetical protein
MKAIEVLTSARQLLSNKKNWAQNGLRIEHDDRVCLCAVGALGVAAGVLDPNGGTTRAGTRLGVIGGIHDVFNDAFITVEREPLATLRRLEENGAHVRAYQKAKDYLDSAAESMFGTAIIGVNDNWGYEATLETFDRAIRNIRRRHMNGKNYATPTRARSL